MKRSTWITILAASGAGAWLALNTHRQPVLLKNKVVMITGASSGIGWAAAHAFAQHGAHPVLVARREEKLQQLATELTAYGVETLVLPADISLEKDVTSLVDDTVARFGRLDILVNNAGMFMGGPLHEANHTEIRNLIAVNLNAVIRLTQLALPTMLEQGSGHVVNVGSMSGLFGAPGQVAYATTKTGVQGFSDALRRELDGTGIEVSLVLPGWTDTSMIARMDREDMREAKMISPVLPVQEVEEVAQAIIDAVRYGKREVPMGGPLFLFGYIGRRILPIGVDWFFRLFLDRKKLIDVMRNAGAE